jgi:hypothetical protein
MKLQVFTQSPYLNLFSGLILLITSGYETWNTIGVDAIGINAIGTHHGVLIFSIIQLLKVFPEIMHGLKDVEMATNLKA